MSTQNKYFYREKKQKRGFVFSSNLGLGFNNEFHYFDYQLSVKIDCLYLEPSVHEIVKYVETYRVKILNVF